MFDDVLNELPGLIERMVAQESGGNPNAVSPKGARGLLQTMPGTESDPGFGVRPLDPAADPTQERYRLGRDYMGAMLKRYGGNVEHALAAYNWGPGNADEWIKAGADPNKLPSETRSYIRNITSGTSAKVNAPTRQASFGGAIGNQASAEATVPMGAGVWSANKVAPDVFDTILSELPSMFGGTSEETTQPMKPVRNEAQQPMARQRQPLAIEGILSKVFA